MNVSSKSNEDYNDQLAARAKLTRPIDASRNISLTWLFFHLSQSQFEAVVDALLQGSIQSKSYLGWLDLVDPFQRTGNKKTPITATEWSNYCLRCPVGHELGIHLIDNENERALIDITMNTSQVNRVLKLTGQNGGQPPKMGPRLYAWLTAWYAYGDPPQDPIELFAIVSEVPELWENGEVDDFRGIATITNYLSSLKEFDVRAWPPKDAML